MEQEMVTITVQEYERLKADSAQLSLLEALGVDNWQGYCTLPDREDYDTEEEWEDACERAYSGDSIGGW